jgi:hypothetical protein
MYFDSTGFIPEMQGWFNTKNVDLCITSLLKWLKEKTGIIISMKLTILS